MTENNALTPFRIDIPQADVDDLRNRLAHTRWPIPVPGRDDRTDFSRGIPLAYLKELAEYWRDGFDWRAQEAKLNEYEQFTTVVDGQTFHVVHARSANPEATPLILNHGWPGSFVEYQRLIPLLTDEFHVVIPSLPGFGFSTPLSGTGWELARTTEAYAEIMTRLGYERFAAHGTDIGSGTAGRLAALYPERVIGMHLGVRPRLARAGRRQVPLPRGPVRRRDRPARGSAYRGRGRARVSRDAEPPSRHDRRGAHRLARRPARVDRREVQDQDQRRPTERRTRRSTATSSSRTSACTGSPAAARRARSSTTSPSTPDSAWSLAAGVPSGWAVFDTHPLIRRAMDPWNGDRPLERVHRGRSLPRDGGARAARGRHPRLLPQHFLTPRQGRGATKMRRQRFVPGYARRSKVGLIRP